MNIITIIVLSAIYGVSIVMGCNLISASYDTKEGSFNGFVFGMGVLIILQALEPLTAELLRGVFP